MSDEPSRLVHRRRKATQNSSPASDRIAAATSSNLTAASLSPAYWSDKPIPNTRKHPPGSNSKMAKIRAAICPAVITAAQSVSWLRKKTAGSGAFDDDPRHRRAPLTHEVAPAFQVGDPFSAPG